MSPVKAEIDFESVENRPFECWRIDMSATMLAEISQDHIAVSVARAMAVANKRARELGIDIFQSLITITQRSLNGDVFWRINYGPKNYIGHRGGDLIVEVDQSDASISQVLWGQ